MQPAVLFTLNAWFHTHRIVCFLSSRFAPTVWCASRWGNATPWAGDFSIMLDKTSTIFHSTYRWYVLNSRAEPYPFSKTPFLPSWHVVTDNEQLMLWHEDSVFAKLISYPKFYAITGNEAQQNLHAIAACFQSHVLAVVMIKMASFERGKIQHT